MQPVTSYSEYLEAIGGLGDVYVFRGQANSSFILIPSGLRESHKNDADSNMFTFVDMMKDTFDFDELTCIEIAQHFGLPTRMLDFSYSFDVALFFACHDRKGKYGNVDGKVYIFNKSKYERMLNKTSGASSDIIRNNKALYEWLQKFVDRKTDVIQTEGIDMPIFIDATRQFDRLHMQKGLFLLWGRYEDNLEKIFADQGLDIDDYIKTIVIKAESKKAILEELKQKNISEDTLYMNINKIKEVVLKLKK